MTKAFRSLLFVPGARPDRFDKAAASGADGVIIDLEDAVLPSEKETARSAALSWLSSEANSVSAGLRINSPRTAAGCADIAALAAAARLPAFIMVPKAETAEDIAIVGEVLSTRQIIAVVESGRSLSNVYAVAREAGAGLLFGGADYSASLGADLADWDAMLMARATIAAAASSAGVASYDVPFLDVADLTGLEAETRRSRALGMSGRACIHPAQVPAVNAAFTPAAVDVADARALLEAADAARAGAVLFKGKLVDRPVILAAQRLIDRAGG